MYEWVGFSLVTIVAFGVAGALTLRPPLDRFRHLVLLGVLFRMIGATLRYEVIGRLYEGVGDSVAYVDYGKLYARHVHRLDFAFLVPEQGSWWGAQFVRSVSAFVLAIVGPSERGGFLAFSLLSFIGLVVAARAFLRVFPHHRRRPYILYWLFFSPSLWFWPSSIGKEALIICAAGLFFAGYVGDGRRVSWPLLTLGALGLFAVRPHVAAVTVATVALVPWLAPARWTAGRVVRALALAGVAVAALVVSLRALGVETPDLEGAMEFQQQRAANTVRGGSRVGVSGGGGAGLAAAYVNVLFRPFPWEAHNPQALLSALEVMAFWGLILSRRRLLRTAFAVWHRHSLLRFSAVFVLLYTPLIGMTMLNLGIVARQRVLLWPFLFFFVEGVAVLSGARAAARPTRPPLAVRATLLQPRRVAC
jgi:hypothetical protein